ncbi:MAG: T9SS type A sorting domain-containing protein, partial [Chitinophagales bacterium]
SIYQTVFDNSTTCGQMDAWAMTNGFSEMAQFNMGGDEITYYGIFGMPTILIFGGGIEHKIFYHGLGELSSETSLKDFTGALDLALVASGVELITDLNDQFNTEKNKVYPNPVSDIINIETDEFNHLLSIQIFDVTGKIMKSFAPVSSSISIPVANFPQGIYFIKLAYNETLSQSIIFVKY